jgi:hypothetical protein
MGNNNSHNFLIECIELPWRDDYVDIGEDDYGIYTKDIKDITYSVFENFPVQISNNRVKVGFITGERMRKDFSYTCSFNYQDKRYKFNSTFFFECNLNYTTTERLQEIEYQGWQNSIALGVEKLIKDAYYNC